MTTSERRAVVWVWLPEPIPPGCQRHSTAAPPNPAVIDAIKQAVDATGAGASKADVLVATGLDDAQWTSAILPRCSPMDRSPSPVPAEALAIIA